MSNQIERLFLIALSAALYYLAAGSPSIFLWTGITVFLCTLNFILKNPFFQFFTFIGALFLCVLFPLFSVFLPVFFYDTLQTVFRWFVLLSPVALLLVWERLPFSVALLNTFFLLLALLMAKRQESIVMLTQDYKAFRETAQELALAQEEKSRSLLENQDYEIRTATLKERNRISKEIHDHVGHVLSRSLLQIGALMTLEKDPVLLEGLAELKASLSEGMDSIRTSIHAMHDESIDLKTSLDELIHAFTFCPVEFQYAISFPPGLKQKYCFIAIVKEGLTNIMKHSNATRVSILLQEEPQQYRLEISDNGTLSAQEQLKLAKAKARNEYSDGIGLQSIYDRVKGFHGTLLIHTENGFQLTALIPKEDSKDEARID